MQVLPGNRNTYVENRNDLHPPIVASKVRFVPYSKHPRTVCMRVELYGCRLPPGSVVSYSAPKGHEFSPHVYLEDVYDGVETGGGRLVGGLGVLADGEFGGDVVFSEHGIVNGELVIHCFLERLQTARPVHVHGSVLTPAYLPPSVQGKYVASSRRVYYPVVRCLLHSYAYAWVHSAHDPIYCLPPLSRIYHPILHLPKTPTTDVRREKAIARRSSNFAPNA